VTVTAAVRVCSASWRSCSPPGSAAPPSGTSAATPRELAAGQPGTGSGGREFGGRPLDQGEDLFLGGLVEDYPVAERFAVGAEQDGERLALDAEVAPAVERRVPQEWERLDTELGAELLGQTKAVLGAQADEIERGTVMSASELLDARRFALAGRSVRGPEPDQQGPLAGVVAREGHGRTGRDVDDIHGG
jgi:hypothetical protein